MRAHLTLLAVAAAGTLACSDAPSPTTAHPGASPLAVISDGAHGGNPFFFFLPPMLKNPHATGTPDATLSPMVLICQLDLSGTACVDNLAAFTTDRSTTTTTRRGNSETIRVSEDHYIRQLAHGELRPRPGRDIPHVRGGGCGRWPPAGASVTPTWTWSRPVRS